MHRPVKVEHWKFTEANIPLIAQDFKGRFSEINIARQFKQIKELTPVAHRKKYMLQKA
jgi:hypothetical protein